MDVREPYRLPVLQSKAFFIGAWGGGAFCIINLFLVTIRFMQPRLTVPEPWLVIPECPFTEGVDIVFLLK